MASIDGNVVFLRSAEQGGQRHLALTMGNGARQTVRSLEIMDEVSQELGRLGRQQESLAGEAGVLTGDFQAIMAQIAHCQALWRELESI